MIIAIVFAAVSISGSLVFFGMQLSGGGASALNLEGAIEQGIKDFVANQQAEQQQQAEQSQAEREMNVGNLRAPSEADFVRGDEDAQITLVEYSDFDCPFCQRVHPTLQQLVDDYDGKVNWVYRHFPLPSHDPSATSKAIATTCAGQLNGDEAFWQFADMLFAQEGSVQGTEEGLTAAAAKLGVNSAKFKECYNSEATRTAVAVDLAEGSVAGVTGTPGTVIYNNETGEKRLVEGAQGYAYFKTRIDEMLK